MIEAIIVLSVFGVSLGSFINATVWRIQKERNFVSERSECDHCHHKLAAKDLVPVLSWLWLKGRCRYCHKKISWQHPVIELTTAALFVVSFVFWPVELGTWQAWFSFICWLIYVVGMLGLFIYDLRWMLLPDKIIFPLMLVAVADVIVRLTSTPGMDLVAASQYIVLSLLSVGGFYGFLYWISKGNWVGFGDVKLGLLIGLVLGWEKALLALVLANLIGFMIIVPGLLTRRLTRKSKVPFGPLLIAAFFLAGLFGSQIIAWYLNLVLLPTY